MRQLARSARALAIGETSQSAARAASPRARSRFVEALALALALAAASGAAGCGAAPARVTQGEAVTTGNGGYDEFFAAVRELRLQALAAESDERATHADLIAALGLEKTATAGAAISEAESRAKKFRDDGLLLHLELTPEATLVTLRTKGDATLDAGDSVLHAIELSTKSALDVGTRLGLLATRAAALEKRRIDLRAQAPATFRGEPQARRDEIIFELDAAAAVIASAGDAGTRSAGLASKFVLDLARAVETGAAASPDAGGKLARGLPKRAAPPQAVTAAKPPDPPPGKQAVASKPPAAAKPPARPAGAAPAKPPPAAAPPDKKPKTSDDFEP